MVHYNCHIKTMLYAVKRQGEIKSFQLLLELCRFRLGCQQGRARKRERSLAEFCSRAWHVIQAAVSRSQTSRRSGKSSSTMSARYTGDLPLCMECISRHSLYCILQRMGSQCSWIRLAVMWSDVCTPKISRAAAF